MMKTCYIANLLKWKGTQFLMNHSIDLKIIKIHRKCKCKHDTSYGVFDYRYAYYPFDLLIYLLI